MVKSLQGLVGVTLSAGVPALQDGSHVNRASFFIGFLYVIALGRQLALSVALRWQRECLLYDAPPQDKLHKTCSPGWYQDMRSLLLRVPRHPCSTLLEGDLIRDD